MRQRSNQIIDGNARLLKNAAKRPSSDFSMIGHNDSCSPASQLDVAAALAHLLEAEPTESTHHVPTRKNGQLRHARRL